MFGNRSQSDYGLHVHRKQALKNAVTVFVVLILLFLVSAAFIRLRGRGRSAIQDLKRLYASGSYDQAYALSREQLREKPLDFSLLTIHGFSAFELALAQINSYDTLTYIDDCIWSLRKAFLSRQSQDDGRIFYILGKAYYYKGPGYADLAVKYLEMARAVSYFARDIPEYLGLAYVAIKDYRGSVAAFSLALNPEEGGGNSGEAFQPSDLFLISIARSYLALNEPETAKAYLIRCIESSRDSKTIVAARLLLGGVFIGAGDAESAESQYTAVIEETGGDAEAHFQLGEIYYAGGDIVRAKAEWRKTLRIDPAHAPARTRQNMQ
jgi:tetratricopeptide (TPR) repeat protein